MDTISRLDLAGFSATARTPAGALFIADSRDVLDLLPTACCDLVFSSPPFDGAGGSALSTSFVDWLSGFFERFERVLKPSGSVVLELGQIWRDEEPSRCTHSLEFVATICARGRWRLLQEFYWYNPHFLHARNECAAEHRRFRECVTSLYWLARTADVAVDIRRVAGQGGSLLWRFGNLLAFDDGPEDAAYTERCAAVGAAPFADRFPVSCPRFFIDLLTAAGDFVIDPFAGSGATGAAAETGGRRWLCVERYLAHASTAALRFASVTRR